ncbi:helix-turn-helix domain-containing protein [Escherichia coli]|nr:MULTISPECIES: helix-turn-helix domain-containing protein [Escherichia]EGH6475609.1 hypothetical protein [Salmonella enterica subsp. enterica serovar Coeln]EIU7773809.1 hypothetical protein [Salmonella enterica]EFE0636505.1 hypothetical protein [Escherichia coli]EGN8026172.1 hypothetical protein [Escherichia coli]EGS5160196.1 hypothetical protein [Escherichia coli]
MLDKNFYVDFRKLFTKVIEIKVSQDNGGQPNLRNLLDEARLAAIEATLIFTNGNQSKAASLLGLNRMTIARIIKKNKIN